MRLVTKSQTILLEDNNGSMRHFTTLQALTEVCRACSSPVSLRARIDCLNRGVLLLAVLDDLRHLAYEEVHLGQCARIV